MRYPRDGKVQKISELNKTKLRPKGNRRGGGRQRKGGDKKLQYNRRSEEGFTRCIELEEKSKPAE